jgi:hypothetical protein
MRHINVTEVQVLLDNTQLPRDIISYIAYIFEVYMVNQSDTFTRFFDALREKRVALSIAELILDFMLLLINGHGINHIHRIHMTVTTLLSTQNDVTSRVRETVPLKSFNPK